MNVVTEPISVALRDIAGPRLYARNAFRLTELATDAGRQPVLHRRQRIVTMRQLDPDLVSEEVLNAFDRILGDPRRRLVDEVFWLWDTPDADCGCSASLHSDHDAAVLAHSKVLDLELNSAADPDQDGPERRQQWIEAARLWKRALGRAAFWDHLRHRITALDDRQLDESAIDVLREEVPVTLVRTLLQNPAALVDPQGWRAEVAREWPVPNRVIDDQLEEAAASLYDRIGRATTEAMAELEAGRPHAAAELLDGSGDDLDRLDELVPPDRHRRTATAMNTVAVGYNNCANALMDQEGSEALTTARSWLAEARAVATNPQTIQTIELNEAGYNELVQEIANLQQRVDQLVRQGQAGMAVTMLRDIRRQLAGEAGTVDIDRMLRDLGQPSTDHDPVYGRPGVPGYRGHPGSRRRAGAKIAVASSLVLLVLVGWLLVRFWPAPAEPMSLFSAETSENAAVGSCVETEEGWQTDKFHVPIVDCGREHWGEVLAYPALGKAPSPYPGADQVGASARFRCAYAQAELGLSAETYTTSVQLPDSGRWNDGSQWENYENYATCVLHRTDGEPLPNHSLTNRSPVAGASVRMDLYGPTIAESPPVGTCVETAESARENIHDVPIVPCEEEHWAQIIGYPKLYEQDDLWPGDQEVYAKAEQACEELAEDYDLNNLYKITTHWPAKDWWEDDSEPEIHAVCLVHRGGDTTLEGPLR